MRMSKLVNFQSSHERSVRRHDVVDSMSTLYPDSADALGFTPGETGFRIVLTTEIAGMVERLVGDDVRALLGRSGLESG